jgi:hypothetical protein
MPVMPEDIQPVAEPAVAEAGEVMPAEESQTPAREPVLPEAVAKIPAVAALMNGSPPVTYGPMDSELPEVKTLSQNANALKKVGFAAFESQSIPGNFVLFNGLIVKPQEVVDADKAGQLEQMGVPFEQLVQSFEAARRGGTTPDATAAPDVAPAALAAPGQAAAAPVSSGPPPSAGTQKRLLGSRVSNLMPGSPTSGPAPGRGRVLNAISKPVV